MPGIFRNTPRTAAQQGVCCGAAITGQKRERFVRIKHVVAGGHDIDGPEIDVMNAVGAPIPHEVRYFFDSVANVLAFDPVNCVDAFAGSHRPHRKTTNVA